MQGGGIDNDAGDCCCVEFPDLSAGNWATLFKGPKTVKNEGNHTCGDKRKNLGADEEGIKGAGKSSQGKINAPVDPRVNESGGCKLNYLSFKKRLSA